ncbi:MAG: NAD(P)/FAD-dependent oxidoreductase [FCB group bacterium]|nr:NAD(P)/FAD-dependent oxidoreductase [FCB group bacterium]
MNKHFDLIIIGGGIAGSAAALRSAQNGQRAIWFLGDKNTRKRSRSQWVKNLDNIIGFHEDVIKTQVLKTLNKAKENRAAELIASEHYEINNRMIIQNTIERLQRDYREIEIRGEIVISVEKSDSGFRVHSPSGDYFAAAVISATGVMDEQPAITQPNRSGELETSPKWLYPFANREQLLYCIRCEGHLTRDEVVAVIGHSSTAAELAMMLFERYENKIYILTNGRKPDFTRDQQTILKHYGVNVKSAKITTIQSERPVKLQGFVLEGGETVEVRFALVSLGIHRVYNDFARQVGAELMDPEMPVDKRHILIDRKGETTVKNFFAVGDAAKRADEPIMKQVYTAMEYAVRAVDTIDNRRRKARRAKLL